MPETMLATRSFLNQEFLSQESVDRADESVFEVFARMLGLPVEVVSPPELTPGVDEERTAIVGYSGAMRGSCEVQMNRGAATAIASAMLGGGPVEDEASLDDAVGEICNMIAGGWKDRVPALSSLCALSPPTVITGRSYKVHMSTPSIKLQRCYRFAGQHLFLTLRREDMGPS